jgi:hypothetical protein
VRAAQAQPAQMHREHAPQLSNQQISRFKNTTAQLVLLAFHQMTAS